MGRRNSDADMYEQPVGISDARITQILSRDVASIELLGLVVMGFLLGELCKRVTPAKLYLAASKWICWLAQVLCASGTLVLYFYFLPVGDKVGSNLNTSFFFYLFFYSFWYDRLWNCFSFLEGYTPYSKVLISVSCGHIFQRTAIFTHSSSLRCWLQNYVFPTVLSLARNLPMSGISWCDSWYAEHKYVQFV